MMNKRFIERLSTLIATPSVSCTIPRFDMSNQAVIAHLANWFRDLGCDIHIQQVAEQKQNLIAQLGPNVDTKVQDGLRGCILAGHSDTVPTDTALWNTDPFQLVQVDNKIYGLGVADMKGFFAVVYEALLQLIEEVPNFIQGLKAPLYIVATCDEETSMAGARALIQGKQLNAPYVLIGEPTNMQPIRAHKGVLLEQIEVVGQSGHSSNPNLGNNAIDAMQLILKGLGQYRDSLKHIRHSDFTVPFTTMNFGCIHGGDNPNRICGSCRLQFDIRPTPNVDIQKIREDISRITEQVADSTGTKIHYHSLSQAIPPFSTEENSVWLEELERSSGMSSGVVGFGTEAPFFNQMGKETVVLGMGSIDQAHQPNEYVSGSQAHAFIDLIKQIIVKHCYGE